MQQGGPSAVFLYNDSDQGWKDALAERLATAGVHVQDPGPISAFGELRREFSLEGQPVLILLYSRSSMGGLTTFQKRHEFDFRDRTPMPVVVNVDGEEFGGTRVDSLGRRPLLPLGPPLNRLEGSATEEALDQIVRETLAALRIEEARPSVEQNQMNPPPPQLRKPSPAVDGPKIPEYAADQPDGQRDLLGIEHDVDAFSWLISAKNVTPPLSVGLFGDWGSGKSFFMRALRRRVDEISRSARESKERQRDISVYKRIVQIEFNAWHYVESNLWASLVEHVFTHLKIEDHEPEEQLKKRQKHLLDTLKLQEEARKKAHDQADEARARKKKAEDHLKKVEQEQKDKLKELQEVSAQDVWKTVTLSPEDQARLNGIRKELGFDDLEKAGKDLNSALGETGALLHRGKSVMATLFQAPAGGARVVQIGLLIVAGLVLGAGLHWLTGQIPGSLEIHKNIAYLTSVLVAGAAGIRRQSVWVNGLVGRLEQIARNRDERIEAERAKQETATARLRTELELLQQQQMAAETRNREAEQLLQETQKELDELNPATQIARLIQDRARSDDYRKHLGLLALIRRDFETLSGLIERQNKELESIETLEAEREKEDQRINRIVLYIDDLDRCPPDKVVDVLQAIHLLLAFPLFIVVVGVDVRWISRALELRYKEMMQATGQSDDRTTPFQYIEKVFQIPFRLDPLNSVAREKMVRGLLQSSVEPGEAKDGGESSDKGIDGKPKQASEGKWIPMHLRPPEAPVPAPAKPALNLKPLSLTLLQKELDFMARVSGLFGGSPRSIKRFANVYRLIKAGLKGPGVERFIEDRGRDTDYKAVLVLLAIVTGMPTRSRAIFEGAASPPRGGTPEPLLGGDALNAFEEIDRPALDRWKAEVLQYSFVP